jgi:protocatechuate 3,4-dioxygenase beta subunit
MRTRRGTRIWTLALVLAGCCGDPDARPADVPSTVELVGPRERGERLVLSGRVFDSDGVTPLAGARLDVYQTDAGGLYSRPINLPREPRIRGSVWTDADGRYELRTIVPGKYPLRREPAHIHVHLAVAGVPEHWIPDFLFAGDPHLREEQRRDNAGRGSFSAVVALERGADGVLRGTRDVRLARAWAEETQLVDGWYQGE